MPILRTFAPFVAGIARMSYLNDTDYNVAGALAWVLSLLYAGYWFGNAPFVKENLTWVILGIIVLSVTPLAFEYVRQRLKGAETEGRPTGESANRREGGTG